MVMETFITPIGTHLCVDEVLIDCREIGGKNFIEQLDDSGLRFHSVLLPAMDG
jgi:hypothetical protein